MVQNYTIMYKQKTPVSGSFVMQKSKGLSKKAYVPHVVSK